MMVGLKRISTAFGLVVALGSVASAQEVAVSPNQTTANAVAGTLLIVDAGILSVGYRIGDSRSTRRPGDAQRRA